MIKSSPNAADPAPAKPDFTVEGTISDAAISALATLLLDFVEREQDQNAAADPPDCTPDSVTAHSPATIPIENAH
ncbi:hypothetical protein Mal52_30850 [Symmachiella dynata]|uniref:Uncharacterized protein n=1 Tax=Symmachiella dynata TaxID=2527995 RepID=A0A517ZQ38_9PLAN|nr:hypothetical protein [Symmachiella dynata]QDU44599.1 hypothetical protein Mal52_30850 [Symmachiella dynata]